MEFWRRGDREEIMKKYIKMIMLDNYRVMKKVKEFKGV